MGKNCVICGRLCGDDRAAGRCFLSHTKDEQLLWALKELYRISAEGYERFDMLDALMAKYGWDEGPEV